MSKCKHCELRLSTLGTPWPQVTELVRKTLTGDPTAAPVQLTHSVMLEGNSTVDSDGTRTVVAMPEDMQAQLALATQAWADAFAAAFSFTYVPRSLSVTIENREETGITISSSVDEPDYSLTSGPAQEEGVGNFRAALVPIDGAGDVLAFAYSPSASLAIGNVGADSRFDSSELWRDDGAATSGAFSALEVAVHELGHSFAMVHTTDPVSVMNATVTTADNFSRFPFGLQFTEDFLVLLKLYSGTPWAMGIDARSGQPVRVHERAITNPSGSVGATLLPGRTRSISVSPPGYFWRVLTNGTIQFGAGVDPSRPFGNGKWQSFGSGFRQVSAGCRVMAVGTRGQVFLRVRMDPSNPAGAAWLAIRAPFRARWIGVASAQHRGFMPTFCVDTRGRVWYRNAMSYSDPRGLSWGLLSASPRMSCVSVGAHGMLVFACGENGHIYRRRGTDFFRRSGTGWVYVADNTGQRWRNVNVSPTGEVYAVARSGRVYHRAGVTFSARNGTRWVATGTTGMTAIDYGLKLQ